MDSTLGKLTVVAVDDDDLALSLMESVLNKDGYEVFTTNDSVSAIKLIEEKRPSIVLSDLMMPKVDGFELCKQVRQHSELNDTKFVVISAKAYHSDENRARELGADGFIRKPINPDTMPDRLRRIVHDQIDLQFWGVRGTLPITGADALKYGGNTSSTMTPIRMTMPSMLSSRWHARNFRIWAATSRVLPPKKPTKFVCNLLFV